MNRQEVKLLFIYACYNIVSEDAPSELIIRFFSVISGTIVGGGLTPMQRSSRCILQPQPTGQFAFWFSCPDVLHGWHWHWIIQEGWYTIKQRNQTSFTRQDVYRPRKLTQDLLIWLNYKVIVLDWAIYILHCVNSQGKCSNTSSYGKTVGNSKFFSRLTRKRKTLNSNSLYSSSNLVFSRILNMSGGLR